MKKCKHEWKNNYSYSGNLSGESYNNTTCKHCDEEIETYVEELEQQIEKMKCCDNCKHGYWDYDSIECKLSPNVFNYQDNDEGNEAYSLAYQASCSGKGDLSSWELD